MTTLTFKKINAFFFVLALVLLIDRKGNFATSYIPKPYEMCVALLSLATFAYLFTRPFRESLARIPRGVRIAVGALVATTLIGWTAASALWHIPSTFNMVLELGTFGIGVLTMLFVLFYGADDRRVARYYLYALLVPGVYALFVIAPGLTPSSFLLADGNFLGLSMNVNIVSKMLLVPMLFCAAHMLYAWKDRWTHIVFFVPAVLCSTLLFWISSRGALLSMAVALCFLWIVYAHYERSWKIRAARLVALVLMLVLGFILVPQNRQQVTVDRLLNADSVQTSYTALEHESLLQIARRSVSRKKTPPAYMVDPRTGALVPPQPGAAGPSPETRLQIWPYYFKLVLTHPTGIGPNTHFESHFVNKNGEVLSSGPHNTYLQILLWGGFAALIAFIYLLYAAAKNLKQRLDERSGIIPIALATIFCALLVAITFDDSLSLFVFWAIIGLSILE